MTDEQRFDCCKTWDSNKVIATTPTMAAVLDAYPVTEGHALVYPVRHVNRFINLTTEEVLEFHRMVRSVQVRQPLIDGWTIGINEGPLAGRTVHHLHAHVIPRREGDVPDPRGGVRRMFIPSSADDPWIARTSG